MWKCPKCSEQVDSNLEVCWNCQADKRGRLPNGTRSSEVADDDAEQKRFSSQKYASKNCAGCQSPLKFLGTKTFHEGANWGILGDLGEIFAGHTNLDMYVCPSCLRVEFFASDTNV
jgi:hypothetical protein